MSPLPPRRVRRLLMLVALLAALVAVIRLARVDEDETPEQGEDFVVDFYGLRYRGNTSSFLDSRVLEYGAYEKPILYFMRDASSDSGTFVDVGANTGQHSMFMSLHVREVHAFEPYPPVLESFEAMIEENGIENIVLHRVGLGSERARLPFFEGSSENQGTGSFVEGFSSKNEFVSEFEIVPGDEVLGAAGIADIEIIKIDVEAYEKPVLEGLADTLLEHRPLVVLELTINPDQQLLFTSAAELEGAFPENYRILAFDRVRSDPRTGAYAFVAPSFDFSRFSQRNLLAFPAEKGDELPLGDVRSASARARRNQ